MVSLESYTITEKAEGIGDVEVEINLKEYDKHLTSYYVMTDSENGTAKEVTTRPSERTVPSSYTVKNGDSLWAIAKLQLGDETKWKALAAKNSIEPPYIVMPQYPPDQEGNKVTAMECDDTVQIGDKVIDGIIVGTYVPKEPEMTEPTENEFIQAEILLNQAEIIAKQKEQDEVLAELLLGQQEVAKNV